MSWTRNNKRDHKIYKKYLIKGQEMNSNTKLEIAVEIIANKIAKAARENDEKIDQYLKEREDMYNGNNKIINKIIEEYGD